MSHLEETSLHIFFLFIYDFDLFCLFSGCSVLLCDFHREQAWCRWLATTANGMRPFKEIALSLFRNIAKASTEEEYCEAVTNLKRSQLWNAPESKRLRDWFGKIWLPQYKVNTRLFYVTKLLIASLS